jgi:hypothetical protein
MSTNTSLHIFDSTPPPHAGLSVYEHRGPIAYVEIDGGAISICATDPAYLRAIAQTFTDAAQRLADQLDIEAARAVNAAAPVPE